MRGLVFLLAIILISLLLIWGTWIGSHARGATAQLREYQNFIDQLQGMAVTSATVDPFAMIVIDEIREFKENK